MALLGFAKIEHEELKASEQNIKNKIYFILVPKITKGPKGPLVD